jgi:Peptidase family M23
MKSGGRSTSPSGSRWSRFSGFSGAPLAFVVLGTSAIVALGAGATWGSDSDGTEETTTAVPIEETTTSVEQAISEETVEAEVIEFRLIQFPVAGPVTYFEDFGACRDNCTRKHAGNDIIGSRLQPLVAAVDGVVHHLVDNHPTAGYGISIEDAEGWQYKYFHLNNDTPGTDDALDDGTWRFAPAIADGAAVTAGQIIGWMGDSGNSELSVPHLHFEIRRPDGTAVDPYYTLRWAQRIQQCEAPYGPFATMFTPIPDPAFEREVPLLAGAGSLLIDHLGLVFPKGEAWKVGSLAFQRSDGRCPDPGTPILPPVAPPVPETTTTTIVEAPPEAPPEPPIEQPQPEPVAPDAPAETAPPSTSAAVTESTSTTVPPSVDASATTTTVLPPSP